MENNCNYYYHKTTIITKPNSRLKFMYRKEQCLSLDTRETLKIAPIHCHFDYHCFS